MHLQVLVKIKAAGVNPVDTYIRSGTYARKPTLPYTPGSDGAGVVHSVGDDVTQIKVSNKNIQNLAFGSIVIEGLHNSL